MKTMLVLYPVVLAALLDTSATAQMPPVLNVRKIEEAVACFSRTGVVDKIDDDAVTITEKVRNNITKSYTFVPIDLLRDGGYIHQRSNGADAYLWKDIKKGDTVTLAALKDDGDGKTYCLQISIRRRPGGKLPASQNPKEDVWYDANRVLNEIENGNDVSDEELLKTWPPEYDPETKLDHPGGLPKTGRLAKYNDLLEANRKRIAEEKKEKELKAKPAEKK